MKCLLEAKFSHIDGGILTFFVFVFVVSVPLSLPLSLGFYYRIISIPVDRTPEYLPDYLLA